MMKKEDGLIDWTQPAATVHNLIRGLDPWPAAYTHLDGEVLKISATRVEAELSGKPGEILSADKTGVRVACGEGGLVIDGLQLPGKKRLAAVNFLSGKPLFNGTLLGE